MTSSSKRRNIVRDLSSERIFPPLLKACVLSIFSFLCSAETPDSIIISGVSSISHPPYSWIDRCKQEPVGSTHHLLKRIFTDLGLTVTYMDPISSTARIEGTGGDVSAGKTMTIFLGMGSDSPSQSTRLSNEPIAVIDGGVFYLKNGKFKVTGVNDLKGKSGMKRDISVGELDIFDKYSLEVNAARDLSMAVRKVVAGEIDYLIIDQFGSRVRVVDEPNVELLSYQPIEEFTRREYLGFAAHSSWDSTISKVDARLKHYAESGYRYYLDKTYFLKWYRQKDCVD